MKRTEQLYEQVMLCMDMTRETGEEELQDIIRNVLDRASAEEYIPLQEKIRISRELFNAFRRLDILQDLIEDEENYRNNGKWYRKYILCKIRKTVPSDRRFLSEERLFDVIQQIVGETNRYVNEASPIVDAETAGRIQSECSAEACGCKRTDYDNKKVSVRSHNHERSG